MRACTRASGTFGPRRAPYIPIGAPNGTLSSAHAVLIFQNRHEQILDRDLATQVPFGMLGRWVWQRREGFSPERVGRAKVPFFHPPSSRICTPSSYWDPRPLGQVRVLRGFNIPGPTQYWISWGEILGFRGVATLSKNWQLWVRTPTSHRHLATPGSNPDLASKFGRIRLTRPRNRKLASKRPHNRLRAKTLGL